MILDMIKYVLSVGISKGFSFLFTTLLFFTLSKEVYGEYQLYYAFAGMFFAPFIDSFLDYYLISSDVNTFDFLKKKILLALLVLVIYILGARYFDYNMQAVTILSLVFFIMSVRSYYVSKFRKKQNFDKEKIVFFIEKFLPLALLLILMASKIEITLMVIISIVMVGAVVSIITAKLIDSGNVLSLNKTTGRNLILAGLSSYFMSAYFKIDQIMLGNMLDKVVLANYSYSVRIVEVVFVVPGLLMSYLFPTFSNQVRLKDISHGRNILGFSLLGLGLAVIYVLVSSYFQKLLFFQADLVLWFSLVIIVVSAGHYLTQICACLGNYSMLAGVSFAGLALNALLNYLFIPKIGATAAAISTLITESFIVISIALYLSGWGQLGARRQ